MRVLFLLAACVTLAGVVRPLRAQPSFQFRIEGPWRASGEPETTVEREYSVRIRTDGAGPGVDGAQGWAFGIQAEGWTIVDGTTMGTLGADVADDPVFGLRDEGFVSTEITEGGGLAHGMVLSLRKEVFLPPVAAPQKVFRFTVRGEVPAEGEACRGGRLFFGEEVQGSGQPVTNHVVLDGASLSPELVGRETLLCPRGPFGYRVEGDLDATTRPGGDPVTVESSVVLRTDIGGVQGWSLSIQSRGACDLVDATTDGTIGADKQFDPAGLRDQGFERTELAPPDRNGGRSGAVSAVVLSFTLPVEVPEGEHRILALELSCDPGDAQDGDVLLHELFFPSNLAAPPGRGKLRGAGEPVKTAVTFGGVTREPDVTDAVSTVEVREPRVAEFVRCDANADGRSDISDAVWLVNELFRGGPETECSDAGDCNDDDLQDLSDAIFAIEFQFLEGSVPPAPFPDCGVAADTTEASCPAGSTACP